MAIVAVAACGGGASTGGAQPPGLAAQVAAAPLSPMLIGRISLSRTHIAFQYAGDVWIVGRDGGEARRIAAPPGTTSDNPAFSPDGSQLAFSRQAGRNWDVYAMPVAGGEARRLTYHPAADSVVGWTPDGKRVLFSASRTSFRRRLFTIQADGGVPLPAELPLPRAAYGSFSPDGARIAYSPMGSAVDSWRFYRGGEKGMVWLASTRDGALERLPQGNYNDFLPMWVGGRIYFISDRTGTFNLYSYDLAAKRTRQITGFETYGVTWTAAASDAIALVCDGRIHLYDPETDRIRVVAVRARPDTAPLQPRTANASRTTEWGTLSHDGGTAVLSARGDVLLLDVRSGRARNMTGTAGAAERFGALSPDGKRVAYFSDESGEYQLHVRDVDSASAKPLKRIDIEPRPTFYLDLVWSPDSKKVAFTDRRLAIWYAEVDSGQVVRVDRSTYSNEDQFAPAWSPDGRYLAYAKRLHNRAGTIFIHDLAAGRTHQVTDGRTHTAWPVFDRSGRYLYFVSSPNAGTSEFGWAVLNGELARSLVTRRAHLVVLRRDQPAPLLPGGDPNPEVRLDEAGPARIDFDGIRRRVVDLPVPARDIAQLAAGGPGQLFVLVNEWPKSSALGAEASPSLYLYDLAKPQLFDQKLVEGIDGFEISGDGGRLLYVKGTDWFAVAAKEVPEPGEGKLDLAKVELRVDPRVEWRQMYREAWRLMRDWFYDPGHHGQDLARLERHYAEYLPSVARRADLNELMSRALGHISVGHLAVAGGDEPDAGPPPRTGLLGADYEISRGRYRFRRIYPSSAYDSPAGSVAAPLDRPGVAVRAGEYLLEVDGQNVEATRSIDSYFEDRVDTPTRVRIGPSPDGAGARTVTVFPIANEGPLRAASWAEHNRRRVEEMSGGRVGYIYVRDYMPAGIMDFIRGLAGYGDRAGVVIDQRYNNGGITPDYLIEWLRRRPIYYYMFRGGDDIATPVNPGPAAPVLLVNESNYSAAETFAFMYKLARVGPIVGTRTGGGGVGPYFFTPLLIDGGRVQVPNRAAYNPDGTSFGIENAGVAPDHEVEITPRDLLAGRDPQLEKAVQVALDEIAKRARVPPKRPKYPVYR